MQNIQTEKNILKIIFLLLLFVPSIIGIILFFLIDNYHKSDEVEELIYFAIFIIGISFILSYFIVKKIESYFSIYRKRIKKNNIALRNNMDQIRILLEESNDMYRDLKKTNKLFSEHVIASHANLKGQITYASKALCKISGYTQEELLGQSHSILKHPDMPNETYKELWETITSGETWLGEIKNQSKDGGHYWTKALIIPDFDAEGQIIGYQSIREDITAHKAREDFMSIMSHELRTPLNSILGFSTILTKDKTIAQKPLSYIDKINTSGKHLLEIINSILDFSKIQNHQFSLENIEFHLYSMLDQLCSTVEGLTANKNIAFDAQIDQELQDFFLGDPTRIKQIIYNLLSNAIKFTPNNGKVTLKVSYENETLHIVVSDTGIGISKKAQEQIFNPFKQADESISRKYGGTGLGLGITKSLVQLMKGTIFLESDEGKGSTFRVTLQIKKSQRVSIS